MGFHINLWSFEGNQREAVVFSDKLQLPLSSTVISMKEFYGRS
jgi:hypothetical protein